MKTTQYVQQERKIAAADTNGIRERWQWGLRILNDPEAMTESGKSLRTGVTEQLIHAAAKVGLNLSRREVQWRIQAARTYKTEAEMRNAITQFKTWFELIQAGFPSYEAPDGEPLADHRTAAEIARDRAAAIARHALDHLQPTLFPTDRFEPELVTLKELRDYTDEMSEMTARFVAHDTERRKYLDQLVKAAGGDESMTWMRAAELLGEQPDGWDKDQ
jgi:hypothetical protein